ncbi:hypothetical protein HDU93_006283 [Gonapodya sp. JEL0774]|nr:hypothetical protein HDU93_006283 [Gonapodya sp. JEL0774]
MSDKAIFDVRGKVCIVTGGASGFGLNLSEKLAQKGGHIVVVDVQEAAGKKVAADIAKKFGVKTSFIRIDLAQPHSVKSLIDSVLKEFGSFDVLVNNAGIADGDWARATEAQDENAKPDHFIRMTNINFISLCYATELAIVHWKRVGKKGVVVNTASMAGLIPQKEPLYAAGKAAVIHFTRCMDQYAPQIRVNAVLPNASPTPLFLNGFDSNSEFHRMMQQHLVTIDQVTDAMMRAIEDESLAARVIRSIPRGNDLYDYRTGKATPLKARA